MNRRELIDKSTWGMRRKRGATFMRKKLGLIVGAAALFSATPLLAQRGDEPVAVPRTIKQGIDFVYVDPDMNNVARRHQRPQNWFQRILSFDFAGGRSGAPNVLFAQLGRGMQQYQATYGRLPQNKIPAGPVLKRGATGKRVQLLRQRLGLRPAGSYDEQLFQAVASYQTVHGIGPADGIVGKGTIASLNRGADYYEKRSRSISSAPSGCRPVRTFNRYVVVDSRRRRSLSVRPRPDRRWHESRRRRAEDEDADDRGHHAQRQGEPLLERPAGAGPQPDREEGRRNGHVATSRASTTKCCRDWGANAPVIDPKTINWKAIASGKQQPTIHVRQLPGPWNSMRNMKFEMPNDYGIYLHDTPHDELFAKNDRWLSNGCVRLQDYRRFATWVFGRVPQPSTPYEETFQLPRPVPVYLTYLTVEPSSNGVVFRPDPYGWDALAMPQMFGSTA